MSNQVQVRITGLVMTNRYGTLTTGQILRTDAAFAQHLVEECRAAEYTAFAQHLVEECRAAEYTAAETGTAAVDAEMIVKLKRKKNPPPSADQLTE